MMNDVAQRHVETGEHWLNLNRPERAVEQFQLALALDLDNGAAYVGLARALRDTEKHDEAEQAINEALRLDPHKPYYLLTKGTVLLARQDYDGAQVLLEQALSFNPQYYPALMLGCSIYLIEQRFIEAEETARQLLELRPDATASHVVLGRALAGQGQREAAHVAFAEALRLAPNNPEAHRELAKLYLHENEFEAARAALTETMRLNPTHRWAKLDLKTTEFYGALRDMRGEPILQGWLYWQWFLSGFSVRMRRAFSGLAALTALSGCIGFALYPALWKSDDGNLLRTTIGGLFILAWYLWRSRPLFEFARDKTEVGSHQLDFQTLRQLIHGPQTPLDDQKKSGE